MEKYITKKSRSRTRRALRVRRGLRGTLERPRLSVVKTNSHLYAQVIDDLQGKTLVSVSTVSKEFKGTENNRKGVTAAKNLGEALGTKAKNAGVSKLVFDRGHSKYHGVIAAFADAVRSTGIEF